MAALVLVGACSDDDATRDDKGAIVEPGPISVFELRVGDCLAPDEKTVGEAEDINAVPCSEPHTQEVFALPSMSDDTDVYPGEAEIRAFADASCLEAFAEYTGTDYLDSDLYFSYLHPSLDSWNEGDDRQIVCVVVANGGEMRGSVRDTTTTEPGGDNEDEEADEGEEDEVEEDR